MDKKGLAILTIILVSTCGAGVVDTLFPDVIPVRPYTGVYITAHYVVGALYQLANSLSIPSIFIIVITVLFLVSIVFHIPVFGVMLLKRERMKHTVNIRHHRGGTVDVNFSNIAKQKEAEREPLDKPKKKIKRKLTTVDKMEILLYGATSVPAENTS